MTVLKMGLSVTVCVLFGQWFNGIEVMQTFPMLLRIGVVSICSWGTLPCCN